jgi:ribonuclease-3
MNRRVAAIDALQHRLNHDFADKALLERALTHASASGGGHRIADNERLEFLGDRVLGLVIAETLMARDPEADAGALAKRFASLVSREACARVARSIDLGEALRLAGGETRRGARDHETIIADACEAVIAALYLELGYPGAAQRVLELWAPLLEEAVDLNAINPKSALQEWAAAQGLSIGVARRTRPSADLSGVGRHWTCPERTRGGRIAASRPESRRLESA